VGCVPAVVEGWRRLLAHWTWSLPLRRCVPCREAAGGQRVSKPSLGLGPWSNTRPRERPIARCLSRLLGSFCAIGALQAWHRALAELPRLRDVRRATQVLSACPWPVALRVHAWIGPDATAVTHGALLQKAPWRLALGVLERLATSGGPSPRHVAAALLRLRGRWALAWRLLAAQPAPWAQRQAQRERGSALGPRGAKGANPEPKALA
jgi:hypothetical protein